MGKTSGDTIKVLYIIQMNQLLYTWIIDLAILGVVQPGGGATCTLLDTPGGVPVCV